MKPEYTELLFRKFPNLYEDHTKTVNQTGICWGFECGDGWFELIYNLSEELEAEILKQPAESRELYRATQVKEKFAGLRFYMHYTTREMDYLIREAEHKSWSICEDCGEPGEVRDIFWLFTLCDECFLDKLAKRLKDQKEPIIERVLKRSFFNKKPKSRFTISYKWRYPFKFWWWKQLPYQIYNNYKYRVWKVKRFFLKLGK
jgi:hypothetical protein